MRILFTLMMLTVGLISCQPQKSANPQTDTVMKPEKNDDGEWDIEVLDTQYSYFLNAVAKPMNMYTESYLKNRNQILVNEWNALFLSGRYPNIVESTVDYDYNENYGLKFEYKLYQVFAFVSWKYGLRLNGLSGADAYR